MGVEVVEGEQYSVLICNTSDTAFGPLFRTGEDNVDHFLDWLYPDPRTLSEGDLEWKVQEWRSLPICDYCDKHTGDTLMPAFIYTRTYKCCDECYELWNDEDE